MLPAALCAALLRLMRLLEAAVHSRRWDTKRRGEFDRGKLLQQLRNEGYSCSTYTFPPGCVFGDHSHGVVRDTAYHPSASSVSTSIDSSP